MPTSRGIVASSGVKRALVTGATGFVGPWVSRALLREGWAVTGVSLTPLPADAVLSASERDAIRWIDADLRDGSRMAQIVGESTPDAIVHLAGISFVPAFGEDPLAGFRTNVETTLSLLASVRQLRGATSLNPVVLVIGSMVESVLPLCSNRQAAPPGSLALNLMDCTRRWTKAGSPF